MDAMRTAEMETAEAESNRYQAMTATEAESNWFEALFEEDCLRVMALLKHHPRLVKVGWESDPSREVEGSTENHWHPRVKRSWMGRTALHVGAKRGCVELIKQVLVLYNLDVARAYSELDDEQATGTALSIVEDVVPMAATSELDVASSKRKEAGGNGKNFAESSQNAAASKDAEQTVRLIPEPAAKKSRDGEKTEQETTRPIVAHWRSQVKNNKADHSVEGTFARWKLIRMSANKKESNVLKSANSSNPLNASRTWSREDLFTLLVSKDGQYELDSLCIAVVQGNREIVDLLNYAMGEVPHNPFDIGKRPRSIGAVKKDKRAPLREVTAKVIAQGLDQLSFGPTFRTSCLELYSKDRDFNFLPREEYLFHFLCTSHFRATAPEDLVDTVRDALWKMVVNCKDNLWRFLLGLHDGQGRCPFHIEMESASVLRIGSGIEFFIGLDREVFEFAMTAPDGTGKGALHRSVGCDSEMIFWNFIGFLCWLQPKFNWHAHWEGHHNWQELWHADRGGSPDWKVFSEIRNFGFRERFLSSNPLQTAIMLPAFEWGQLSDLEEYLSRLEEELSDLEEHGEPSGPFGMNAILQSPDMRNMCYRLTSNLVKERYAWTHVDLDNMELACLVGNYWVVKRLLEGGYLGEKEKFEKNVVNGDWPEVNTFLKHPWHPIHITSATGNYEILKLFIDHPQFDPLLEDFEGNTPLHHALNVTELKFKPHLLDYVSLKHMVATDLRKKLDDVRDKDCILERQACINILLQAGCDIFKVNNRGQVPHPQGRWSKNKEFRSWWNDKQLKEFGSFQKSMNIASNAIAVTATLVATASYVGPLQPPLGYTTDTDQIRYGNDWVAMFIFCDTLSFYLAIVAIIFSLVPSLPVPQQAMVKELRRKNTMVVLAIGALYPSIFCVLLAFAASSMAVVSANITSSIGGKLTISTLCISAPLILAAFCVCLYRLLGILFPRNRWIRYMYKYTSF